MSLSKAPKGNLGPRKPLNATTTGVPTPTAPSVASSFVEQSRTKMTVFVDTDLHRRFKSTVAATGGTMRDVVEELLEEWTRRNS
ncbi:hypothetical protein GS966_25465 [Rhodococcus hoagii]|jgi:hypothetical protein|nr:hypothetical protein [Prescottella equi]NKS61644.1 hypothetical protein [Prescottella equi]NKZ93251.1 hypothetical protein [Prescottella equi]